MKNLWLFGFLVILINVFFIPGCLTNAHVGMYQYVHNPVGDYQTQIFPVYLDKDFGEADKVDIANALDQWNFVFNGHAKFVIVNDRFDMEPSILQVAARDNAWLILKVTSSNPLVQAADDVVDSEHNGVPHGYSLGFTPQLGSHHVYIVRDRMDNGDVYFIVMHELGHSLGAEHTASGLMFPRYRRELFQCVDQSASDQVAKAQGWHNDLNYCVPSDAAKSRVIKEGSTEQQQRLDPAVDIIRR